VEKKRREKSNRDAASELDKGKNFNDAMSVVIEITAEIEKAPPMYSPAATFSLRQEKLFCILSEDAWSKNSIGRDAAQIAWKKFI
jgi:hypothetical protein